jgi:hypothetical protein
MTLHKIVRTILFGALMAVLATSAAPVSAQTSGSSDQKETRNDETNLDTQLYLLIATNQDVDEAKLPGSLTPVLAQLRSSLPFKNYRLAATLINRVKNDGRLSLQWVGGPLLPSAAARDMVRMEGFRFGARIPIQTGTAVASNGPAAPIINYENTGLNTDISMREGEAVIVGTLNVGPSGDAIILVMSAKRSSKP